MNESSFSQSSTGGSSIEFDPLQLLMKSYDSASSCGSATSVLCLINNRNLVAANLGDSGFYLIRSQTGNDISNYTPYIALKSKPMQHSFNTPFQITKMPGPSQLQQIKTHLREDTLKELKKKIINHQICHNVPKEAQLYQVQLKENDLLILGSDGLFDNVFKHEILQYLEVRVP